MSQNKITPIDKNFLITNEEKVAEILKAFFTEIVVNLKIPEHKGLLTRLEDNQDPISNIIEKYKNHLSIDAIKNAFSSHSFAFETVNMD